MFCKMRTKNAATPKLCDEDAFVEGNAIMIMQRDANPTKGRFAVGTSNQSHLSHAKKQDNATERKREGSFRKFPSQNTSL